jgi:hypothetical protein
MVPVVTASSTLGASLAMDFSMTDGPSTSHNDNYVHSWLQDAAEAYKLPLDKNHMLCYVGLPRSTFGHVNTALSANCKYGRSYCSFPNLGRFSLRTNAR